MKSVEMVKTRYTTKRYDSNYKLPDDVLNNIEEILRYSPSSINSQPWRFTFIKNQELKERLAEVSKHNDHRVRDCSLLVVLSGLTYAEFLKQFDKYAIEGAKVYYEKNMSSKTPEEITAWIKNQIYISIGFALASLAHDGIDSTALEGILQPEYEKILGVDISKERVYLALAIGKRDPEDSNQPHLNPKSRIDREVIIKEIL